MINTPALTTWSRTAPPCAGWFNASMTRDPRVRRYWNGRTWSMAVEVGDTDAGAAAAQAIATTRSNAEFIEWRGLSAPVA